MEEVMEPVGVPSRLARLVDSKPFTRLVTVVILLAGIQVGISTNDAVVEGHGPLLERLEIFILAFFTVEILMKLLARWPRPWAYFRDGWNVFDFVIVALCFLPAGGHFLAVVRLFRLLRVLRLITVLPHLQVLVSAMIRSIPSMGYVVLLLSLLFYVYGVTGVFLFAENDPENWGNLPAAWLTLFQIVTLENWPDLMDTQVKGDGPGPGVPLPVAAPLFFTSFIFIGTMGVMNLIIGVLIESMDAAHRDMAQTTLEKRRNGGAPEAGDRAARLEEVKRKLREALEELDRLK